VWPDGAKFRHLGEIFWRWAHFFLKNIAQMICAQLFSVRSPKFHLHNLYIMATFCLLISIFWSGEKVLFGKAPFWALFRSKFGAFFTTRRVTLFTSEEGFVRKDSESNNVGRVTRWVCKKSPKM
jgi:hypothetical protein